MLTQNASECSSCAGNYGKKFCSDCGKKFEYNDISRAKLKIKALFTNLCVYEFKEENYTIEYFIKRYTDAFEKAIALCIIPFIVDINHAEHYNVYKGNKGDYCAFIIKSVNVYTAEEFLQKCNINTKNYKTDWLKYGYRYVNLNANGYLKTYKKSEEYPNPTTFIVDGKKVIQGDCGDFLKSFKFKENDKLYMIFPCNYHQVDFYTYNDCVKPKTNEVFHKCPIEFMPNITSLHPIFILDDSHIRKDISDVENNGKIMFHDEFTDDKLQRVLKQPLECKKYDGCGYCIKDKVFTYYENEECGYHSYLTYIWDIWMMDIIREHNQKLFSIDGCMTRFDKSAFEI